MHRPKMKAFDWFTNRLCSFKTKFVVFNRKPTEIEMFFHFKSHVQNVFGKRLFVCMKGNLTVTHCYMN